MKRTISLILVLTIVLSGMAGCGGDGAQSGEAVAQQPANDTAESGQPTQAEPTEAQEESVPEPREEEEEPVDNSWEIGAPEQFGVDSAVIEEINRKIASSEMLAVVTVKDGVIIQEFYREGYDENSVFGMHSVTKSVMGSLIGIALEQGILEGVDTPLAEIFPQLADSDDEWKQAVTIEHLLTHTSGIGRGDSESFGALVQSENWVDYYLSLPMSAEPGTAFHYSTAGSHMLSAVLEQAAGVSTHDFALEHLFGPIGIESAVWDTDPQGVTDGGNGLHLSVRDAARFGQLFLDEGNWRGRQVVPREWVEVSTAEHAVGESDKGTYGYQWWIRSFGGYDCYYALGYAGQFVFVAPELGIVTAVASKSIWSDYTGQVCFAEIVRAFA